MAFSFPFLVEAEQRKSTLQSTLINLLSRKDHAHQRICGGKKREKLQSVSQMRQFDLSHGRSFEVGGYRLHESATSV
jgi:hypothetical protein